MLVTGHNACVAASLYTRVSRRLPLLARRMIDTFLDEVPFYRQLPVEQLEGEILDICADNLRIFFATLQEGRTPTEAELAEPRSSAARRAQERIPLDAVLTAYHVGGRVGWAELVAEARPDETAELIAAGDRVQQYVQCLTSAVATAYLEEQQAISGEERDVRRALAAALMAGQPADALAARLGVDLGSRWNVVALELAEHVDEKAAGVAGAVAARRKVRRVQAVLDERAAGQVLGLFDATGGTVFLPDDGRDITSLADQLQVAAGVSVRAAAACGVDTERLASASAQVREVLRLTARLGRPPGLYFLADVLLEYQLTRPSDALSGLAAVLEPLERNPDLLLTLDTYLAENLDRRRTAAALHVHPNTLDYRLKRIVGLTGLEPTSTSGLQLLAAAALARRLTSG
ncbi:MAG: transcriptional regulator, CdaR [Frankiales bacterium]|jgi:sugar diacid utilization regulator|nr:transcriptional regulator, CdaR [Frankiales bacterium]